MVENQHQQISGYRDMPQEDIDLINKIKEKEQELVDLISTMADRNTRWAKLAVTHLETGFMYLNKTVARPTNGLGNL